jgi:type III secretion system TyeA family effector delivery regulator
MASQAAEHKLNGQQLLLTLLKAMSAGWIPVSHFERMARDFGIPDGKPCIYFLTGLIQIIRDIPLKVFEDMTVRSALLESIQGALDAAIEREETRIEQETESNTNRQQMG